ncbi:membrane protein insertion efficiency factor YidD [Myxococcota bacterium]|nr:membrane protein insertion efficiency factor YidD [Myxococcota bacterium]MBU1899861.1 membrane protein insertion efficiency factor YidD [Myxococcota bacterium]
MKYSALHQVDVLYEKEVKYPSYRKFPWWLSLPSIFFVLGIGCYRVFYPVRLRRVCIFEPSCSLYAMIAFKNYSSWNALSIVIKRLKRCDSHVSRGGYDPPTSDYSC